MKKLLIFIVLFCYTVVSFSQIEYGIKGGLNLATVRYINEDNSKARIAFNAGVFGEIPVQENLFIRPELLYSSKGFAYSASQFAREGSLRLNYIIVPLLVGYRPEAKVAFMAGPEFGFLQKAVSKSQGISNDMTNFYRHFDVGFDLGASYNFSQYFGIEGRYNYGFKDLVNVVITDNSGNVVGQGKSGANSVLQLGLYFYLSK
ncbi:MAG: PorT family protein [Bacteroidota bacterium]|nr:PorT family protein [Bacteroidota bacterium]